MLPNSPATASGFLRELSHAPATQATEPVSTMTEVAASLTGITVTYPGRPPVPALRGADLVAAVGRVTVLLGRNGAGKSTLLAVAAGLCTPRSGAVNVLGQQGSFTPADRPGRRWLLERRTRESLGVVLQDGGAYSAAPVADLLRLHAGLARAPAPLAQVIADHGLAPLLSRRLSRLSGGEQRRVCLALAVLGRPRLLLLDEPTSGMDQPTRERVWEQLTALRDSGAAVILSTHDMSEASALADEVVVIDQGRTLIHGSLTSVLTGRGREVTIPIRDEPPSPAALAALGAAMGPGIGIASVGGRELRLTGPLTGAHCDAAAAWAQANGLPADGVALRPVDLGALVRSLTDTPSAAP